MRLKQCDEPWNSSALNDAEARGKKALTVNRRDLFRILGAGLLMLIPGLGADAQETGRGGGGRRRGAAPTPISAWLHIAKDGRVTVYTGKTEVGQNIRTSLSQAVADELHVPVGSIEMVMADTDLTPYDMGTFGSRTTPTMAPQLRSAAAAAREALIDLAVAQWQVDRTLLTTSEGSVHHAATHRSLSYGALCQGQQLTQIIGPEVALTPTAGWTVAGTSVPKVDGHAFVTGRHDYVSDIKRDGMLYGRVLRPTAFGAALQSVDLSKAQAMPGIVAFHEGDFVAVAAPTRRDADRALAAITAEWKTTPQSSEHELFPLLHPGYTPHSANEDPDVRSPGASPTVDRKMHAMYTVAYIAHAPLEPRAAVAEWTGDRLTIWTGTQRPFGVRTDLAQALGVPENRVRVIVPDTGSGYGGKHTGEAAIEAARLARAAGKPVKIVWTREEEFTWAYFRPAGVIEVSATAKADGTLTEWAFDNYGSGPSGIRSPYDVPGQRADYHSAPSPLRQGSYRGLAATANHFARESHMDDLAHACGIDPLAFRLKNSKDERLTAVLRAAAQKFGWDTRKAVPGRGFGIAGGTEKGSYVATCAEIGWDKASGEVRVTRAVVAFECGAVVNPVHLQNQVEGATIMGIGGALFEAIHFEQGKITNPHFAAYRVPRFRDAPAIEVVLVDRKDLPSAGAGETPIVAIAPAIGNAIFNATGRRLRSLPMAPHGLPPV